MKVQGKGALIIVNSGILIHKSCLLKDFTGTNAIFPEMALIMTVKFFH